MNMASGQTGAYGGDRALSSATPDPLTFVKRPAVILRIISLVAAIIVFGGISSQGWSYSNLLKRDVCVINESSSACNFSTFVGVIGLIVSVAGLVGEWHFEQMSSVKTRKHFVVLDLSFSLLWSAFNFIAFVFMSYSWSQSSEKYAYSGSTVAGAIFFSFLSVLTWAGSAYFAYTRYQIGTSAVFAPHDAFAEAGVDDVIGTAEDAFADAELNAGQQQ